MRSLRRRGVIRAVTMLGALGSAAILTLIPFAAAGQHDHHGPDSNDPDVETFLMEARRASERYRKLDEAIAAGYRLVGPDFPGMGEHWVNMRLVTRQVVDPERPSVLSYLRVNGEPLLTGVAFTQSLRRGEPLPSFPSPGAWHFHDGSIDEETLHLNPHAMHDEGDEPEVRMAMLHAWVWVDNPAGTFAQDNWALPFVRFGLVPPAEVSPRAGKALFLLTGGVDYYARLIQLAGAPDEKEDLAIRAILTSHHKRVAAAVAGVAGGGNGMSQETLDLLASLWMSVWSDVERSVSRGLWKRIRKLAG